MASSHLAKTAYAEAYRGVNFRHHPEKYVVGRGEQGVLIAEPYKSELLPHWKFATPELAELSAQKICSMFEAYKQQDDFVGMDMARKFLQMGFTRARRYANHASGNKYDEQGKIRQQDDTWASSSKAASAKIFYKYYVQAREDSVYKNMKEQLTHPSA